MWLLSRSFLSATDVSSVSTPVSPFDKTFSLYRNDLNAELTRSLSFVMSERRAAWPPPATVLASIASPLSSSSTLDFLENGLNFAMEDTSSAMMNVAQAVAVKWVRRTALGLPEEEG